MNTLKQAAINKDRARRKRINTSSPAHSPTVKKDLQVERMATRLREKNGELQISPLHLDICTLLAEHSGKPAKMKYSHHNIVSDETRDKKATTIFNAFKQLRGLGYKIERSHSLGQKHLIALFSLWQNQNLSASTIENRVSVLRQFCCWMGKFGIVDDAKAQLSKPLPKRAYGATSDKTWTGNGIDVLSKIEEVANENLIIGLQLKLQYHFGLRRKESWLFQPCIADCLDMIELSRGTKGGRGRVIAIKTVEQRQLLDTCRSLFKGKATMVPKTYKTLKEWENHYAYVLRKHGITKNELGISSHGLRHEFANEQYEKLEGGPSPIKGGVLRPQQDMTTRYRISQMLGHGRPYVTSCYISSPGLLKRHHAETQNKDIA
ncbi:hypothetical protein HA050_11675 [Iodobacter sp. HSC-16F04]|uniref:Putative integrase N-terminal domain-containing protein n=1 Tax=Iodobacter violaceini TaxID=3044271 RepID=A0ABX0KS66_9NEIS|nr:phage integrase N-terminal domain-containing protein [Iodobacter violacea]NHQ86777.1 hypothetical protein [Iodobacter violacea]